ncbi:MAG: hypothetical protein LBH98_00445 [Chitinispirillales bacterium]|jgi:hypothetical protein|nr:hypothetical protein [Chitinispirillales bacterium]
MTRTNPYILTSQNGTSVPSGGSQGQVLTKRSNNDFDAEWQTPQGGGGVVNNVFYSSKINHNEYSSQATISLGVGTGVLAGAYQASIMPIIFPQAVTSIRVRLYGGALSGGNISIQRWNGTAWTGATDSQQFGALGDTDAGLTQRVYNFGIGSDVPFYSAIPANTPLRLSIQPSGAIAQNSGIQSETIINP